MQAAVTSSVQAPFPADGLQPPIASSQTCGWQNILVEEFQQPPGQEKYQSLTEHSLCLALNPRPARLWQVMGDRRHTSLFYKGDLTLAPAGAPLFSQWHQDDRYLRIRIASAFVDRVAQEAIDPALRRVELLPEFQVRDPQIEQMSLLLLQELYSEGLAGRLYVQSLTNLLAVRLIRNYSALQHAAIQPGLAPYHGGLSDAQLLQITDYISEHLADDIQLSELAELLGLSQFHFSRLFKQAKQVSPYRYVLQQRIEKAKQLLATTRLSVMEIAMLCGFSSHSHLGKLFRQHTGMTPKAYRNVKAN